jgi:uncharacterized protein (DUF1778 family)
MAMVTRGQSRDRRLQIRATASEDLSDQTRFILDDKQWKLFMEALDRPPREKHRLRRLFSERHVTMRRS